jgi:REP element-mobilizing transposase RayT
VLLVLLVCWGGCWVGPHQLNNIVVVGSGRTNLIILHDYFKLLHPETGIIKRFWPQYHSVKDIPKLAREKRHDVAGHIWLITQRCHNKSFFLKFARCRRRWIEWLCWAKKRYRGLSVLNCMVTSNHIHLLVFDNGGRDVNPNSIQLLAVRTAQECNTGNNRKGAFGQARFRGRGK